MHNILFFSPEIGPPPHHHPNQRIPPPGLSDPPPWGGNQHPEFGPPPHGFNGQAPQMRRQTPSHVSQDDPSLVPNVPYFDLPAGLMAPLVKVISHSTSAGKVDVCFVSLVLNVTLSFLFNNSLKIMIISLWTPKTSVCRPQCLPVNVCWPRWRRFTARRPTTDPETGEHQCDCS